MTKELNSERRKETLRCSVVTGSFGLIRHRHPSSFVIDDSHSLLADQRRALPAAKEILTSVRLQQAQQQIDLQGQLRENEKVIPFRLTQTGPVIRYTFSNPDEALQLRLGENDSRLEEVTRSGVEKSHRRSSITKCAAPASPTRTSR